MVRACSKRPRLSFRALKTLGESVRALEYSQQWSRQEPERTTRPMIEDERIIDSTNPLREYFDSHDTGRGIWKWNHYFEIYHRHLAKFVGREVHVVEIGVYSGGSLDMWKAYFGPCSHIYGVDIEPACKTYEDGKTKIFVGDQADRSFWRNFRSQVRSVDILIDDGGHQPEQQRVTLEEMLPHLNPGGVYICEDIHGVHNPFSGYLSGLESSIHAVRPGSGVPTGFQKDVHSVHIYPYVAVIERSERPRVELIAPRRGTEWQPFL
jgi:hypothetical protein